MLKLSLKTLALFSSSGLALYAVPIDRDVIVYGGTSGGVAAAVQVKRSGKSVILISPTAHLGGLSSSGLGWTDLGNTAILGGISREFYQKIYTHYQSPAAWNWQTQASFGNAGQGGPAFNATTGIASVFEPKVAEATFNALIATAGVEVVTGRLDLAAGVTKVAGKITKLRLENGQEYGGKMFIDASYEGDLLPGAGVSFAVGREANSTYGETFNGIQTARATKNQLPANIDPYVTAGDAGSGLLPGVQATAGGVDGAGDAKLQAYCYRMCLTDVAANRVMVAQPAGYQEAAYELVFRAIAAGQTTGFFKLDLMPNRKTDSNNSGGISTDYIGKNYGPGWDWTTLNHAQREALGLEHQNWQRGLLWTLQNSSRVPVAIRNAYANWGLPADEFADNNNWPYQIYVRESRRMISDYVMTQANAAAALTANDSVGLAAYAMDSHHVQRHVVGGFVKNEGDVQMPVAQPFPISFRSIVPKQSECSNLLVPWSISASHMAFGSIRMEPVFMGLSQSAAFAAVEAIDRNSAVQEVPYSVLRPKLLAAGQALGAAVTAQPATIIDNTDGTLLTLTGTWVSSAATTGFVGTDYLHDNNELQGTKSVFYKFPATTSGTQHVWLRWTATSNRASNVRVEISHQGGTEVKIVDQRSNGGAWVHLGIYSCTGAAVEGVRISNLAANGFVIADAVGLAAVTPTDDRDDDGITDVRETELGMNPFVSDAAFIAAVKSRPGILGLRSGTEIYDLQLGNPRSALNAFAVDLNDSSALLASYQTPISFIPQRSFYRAAVLAPPANFVQKLASGQAQKVVVYGTSLTANGAWVGVMNTWLSGKFPGLLTVINSGLSGKSSVEGVAQLATKVLANNPDTVIIEFAVNDAFRYTDGTPQLTPAQAKANLNSMIDSIRTLNPAAEIILQTMNPAWDSPSGSNASGTLRPNLADFYNVYREVANERRLLLLDHFKQWETLRQSNLAAFQLAVPDGVHPTATALNTHMVPLLKWKLSGGAE
jgi:lysophospholipase L1-like esterase